MYICRILSLLASVPRIGTKKTPSRHGMHSHKPESEHSQGSVGLMACLGVQFPAPEVMLEDGREWRLGLQVFIVENCLTVVKDKVPIIAISKAEHSQAEYCSGCHGKCDFGQGKSSPILHTASPCSVQPLFLSCAVSAGQTGAWHGSTASFCMRWKGKCHEFFVVVFFPSKTAYIISRPNNLVHTIYKYNEDFTWFFFLPFKICLEKQACARRKLQQFQDPKIHLE